MIAIPAASIEPKHFAWSVDGKVATIMINRPERKNPLTFESYAELRDTFRTLQHVDDIKTIVITGEGGNFCSGGDVHEIIGPLLDMDMKELLRFTEMTGDVVKAMRACPQPIVAAIEARDALGIAGLIGDQLAPTHDDLMSQLGLEGLGLDGLDLEALGLDEADLADE